MALPQVFSKANGNLTAEITHEIGDDHFALVQGVGVTAVMQGQTLAAGVLTSSPQSGSVQLPSGTLTDATIVGSDNNTVILGPGNDVVIGQGTEIIPGGLNSTKIDGGAQLVVLSDEATFVFSQTENFGGLAPLQTLSSFSGAETAHFAAEQESGGIASFLQSLGANSLHSDHGGAYGGAACEIGGPGPLFTALTLIVGTSHELDF